MKGRFAGWLKKSVCWLFISLLIVFFTGLAVIGEASKILWGFIRSKI